MGIGTSSSSSGASAPRANAYAVNRDASELRRSRAQGTGLSPAWPDACHLFGQIGPLGAVWLRLAWAGVILLVAVRPRPWRFRRPILAGAGPPALVTPGLTPLLP